jgi:ribokinase
VTTVNRHPVLVIGSANLDYIVQVTSAPRPGQTVLARTMIKHPGGKGANQAVAAARLGAEARFVGCVGDDDDGELLLRELRAEGVDTTGVEIVSGERTGLALVSVFDSGENSITVVPGANFALDAARVVRVIPSSTDQTVVIVMQAEVREGIIAAVTAASPGHRVVMNLAPFRHMDDATLAACDPLVMNQSEAAAKVGFEIDTPEAARRAMRTLLERVRSCVITLGAEGAIWGDQTMSGHVVAPPVSAVVDTTGAGDAFVGALAGELGRGSSLGEATALGVRAGSFAVGRFGAQSSYPMRADLLLDSAAAV